MTDLHFRVKPTSPVMKAVDEIKASIVARSKAMKRVRKELKIPKEWLWYGYQEGAVLGIRGPDYNAPRYDKPGWRWDSKNRYNAPAKLTPEGKKIADALTTIPGETNSRSLSARIFGHGLVFNGMSTCWAVLGWTQRGVVVTMNAAVKKASKTWPTGLVEITGSEADAIMNTKTEKVA